MDLYNFVKAIEIVFPKVQTNMKHLVEKIVDDISLTMNELLVISYHYFFHNQQLHHQDLHQYNYDLN
jgi:hypothetical protein